MRRSFAFIELTSHLSFIDIRLELHIVTQCVFIVVGKYIIICYYDVGRY